MTFSVKFSFIIFLFPIIFISTNISIVQAKIKTKPFPDPLGNTPLNNTKEPQLPKTIYHGYDEGLAIDKMFPMAAASYGKHDSDYTDCLQKTFTTGVTLIRSFTLDCSVMNGKSGDNLCAAFIAMSEQDQAIILSFRGTTDPIQFFDMIGDSFNQQLPAYPAGKANLYFQDVLNKFHDLSLMNYVYREVLVNPTYDLWITGASLGGALAALGAGMLVEYYKVKPEIIKLVTFAQPRTGDKEWADSMEIIPYKYRVVQGMDVVPHVPFQSMPKFVDNGSPGIDFSFKYLHFRGEVWYPDGSEKRGNYKVCNSTYEDDKCSNQNFGITNAPNAVLGMIAKGCHEGLNPSQYKAFEFISAAWDWAVEKAKEGWEWVKDTAEEVASSVAVVAVTAYKCLSGEANELVKHLNIKGEHENYFGLNFKIYGLSGCKNKER